MRLLWLPDRLKAWGLPVVEIAGWEQRGRDLPGMPTVAIGHHTATSARAKGDLPTRSILVAGRPDLPGPLCQVALGRTGIAYVIAAGKANHAGRGAWRGVTNSAQTIGCEVEHPGTGPWSPQLLDAFDLVMAALLDGIGQSAGHYCGHREWAIPAGRKVDPGGVDLEQQRERIARLLRRGPLADAKPKPKPPPIVLPGVEVFELIETTDTRRLYALSAVGLSHIASMEQWWAMVRLGCFGKPNAPVESTKVTQVDVDLTNGVLG